MRPYYFSEYAVGATNPSRGTAVSADSKTVASGFVHGQLRIWDNVLQEDWNTLAYGIANRNLTPDEWRLYFGSQKYRLTCPNLPSGSDAVASQPVAVK